MYLPQNGASMRCNYMAMVSTLSGGDCVLVSHRCNNHVCIESAIVEMTAENDRAARQSRLLAQHKEGSSLERKHQKQIQSDHIFGGQNEEARVRIECQNGETRSHIQRAKKGSKKTTVVRKSEKFERRSKAKVKLDHE